MLGLIGYESSDCIIRSAEMHVSVTRRAYTWSSGPGLHVHTDTHLLLTRLRHARIEVRVCHERTVHVISVRRFTCPPNSLQAPQPAAILLSAFVNKITNIYILFLEWMIFTTHSHSPIFCVNQRKSSFKHLCNSDVYTYITVSGM